MALDARYFFTRVITLVFCSVRISHALRINDHEGGVLAPSTADADRANHIFLMPAPAG